MNTVAQQNSLLVCLGGKQVMPCENFKQASEMVRQYITLNNYGVSEFYKKKSAGMIYHHTKGIIAEVSYNGRVWESNGKFKLQKPEITNLLNCEL